MVIEFMISSPVMIAVSRSVTSVDVSCAARRGRAHSLAPRPLLFDDVPVSPARGACYFG
jgi:hypothetical protein